VFDLREKAPHNAFCECLSLETMSTCLFPVTAFKELEVSCVF